MGNGVYKAEKESEDSNYLNLMHLIFCLGHAKFPIFSNIFVLLITQYSIRNA